MNNLEERRSKINNCMAELFNIYMVDKKQIVGSIETDGVKCKLVFGDSEPEKQLTFKSLENVAINCTSKNEAVRVCTLASKLNDKFKSEMYGLQTKWGIYKGDTCYDLYKGTVSSLLLFEQKGYTIHSAQWFLDNFKIKE